MKKKITFIRFAIILSIALASAISAFGQASGSVVKVKGYASVDGVRPGDKFRVAVALEITKGYHINAHVPTLDYLIATDLKLAPVSGLRFSNVQYPNPKKYKFEFAADEELAVHEGTILLVAEVEADRSLAQGETIINGTVTVQACNDTQCLAPDDLNVEIPVKVVAAGEAVQAANSEIFGLAEFKGAETEDEFSKLLASQGLLGMLIGVFLAGLALNLTPCVYPIIPITIGFFANQSAGDKSPRLRRTFSMAAMYVLGMAITYSILGVIAAMTGGLFGAALQSPIVLIGLAALMVGLALSMFGVYEFRLPAFLNRFATQSTQSTSGVVGALVMGLTMGIVAAPCIGPFVLALLVHVSAKADPVYGFFMFFVLALGLGAPYLALGTFSGSIKSLPRSGEWMVTVRKVFGLVLIGMALYFLMPLMGNFTNYIFIAFFALSALYLIFWEAGRTKPKTFAWILRAIGVGAAVIAVFFAMPKNIEAGITWQPYSEQAIETARREGKGVIIDTYADWCIPCKELDQLTFTDPDVKKDAERFVTLKLDLTRSDSGSEAGRAKDKFGIRGVPTIIFLDARGQELEDLRLEGFEKAEDFLARMKKIESPVSAAGEMLAKNNADGNAPATDASSNGAFEPLPAITLNLLDGNKLDLARQRGKVVLIDFWATWCVPCISEIPMFNEFDKKYKAQGFELIAISLDEEGADIVKPFLKKYPMSYTQVIGDRATAEAFKVSDSSLPVALIVDKQGRIRFRHVGVTKKEVFEANLNELLNE